MGDSDIRLSPTQLVAIIVAVLGIGGANYFMRSDPYTGTRGDVHEDRTHRLEQALSAFMAGEAHVRKQHDEMHSDMKEMLKIWKAEEKSDGRFHRDMEWIKKRLESMQKEQRDHFRLYHK